MEQASYQQMTHISREGMALNIKNTQDKFDLFMFGIEFIDQNDKEYLISLVKDFVPQYQKLNPYALAVGHIMIKESRGPINKAGLIAADGKLQNNSNFEGIPLEQLVSVSDILRYARLIEALRLQRQTGVQSSFEPQPDERSDCDIEMMYEDEYDDDNMFDEYGEFRDDDEF